jgi:hypothetical protein
VMTWMAGRPENGTEIKILYDKGVWLPCLTRLALRVGPRQVRRLRAQVDKGAQAHICIGHSWQPNRPRSELQTPFFYYSRTPL